jgi:hypothetical protein
MHESVNVTVLMSNDWLSGFSFVFMHFTCLLLLGAGEVVQCMCTDLFAFTFFFFFIELFLHFDRIYCDLCKCYTVVFVFVSIYFIFI